MRPETRFKVRVLRELRGRGAWAFKVQLRALRGIPDVIGCWQGYFFALELKTEDEEPDPLQRRVMHLIRKAGGKAEIAKPSNYLKIINEWDKQIHSQLSK